jgi:hypothetical protein
MNQPRPIPRAASQSERASSRSATTSGAVLAAAGSISRRRASSTASWSAVTPLVASRALDDSRAAPASCSAPAARVAADAGLLISWANPAASVPSATSASRCRATDSMFRTVPTRPLMKWTPNGNQRSPSSRSTVAGTRSIRPAELARPVAR